jgi:hypothetical protein
LSHFNTDRKLDLAQNRETTCEDDFAYSLLGVFEVSMHVVYGEGRTNAVRQHTKKILRTLSWAFSRSGCLLCMEREVLLIQSDG